MLHSHIEDDFLPREVYAGLRAYADTAEYVDIQSPIDSVFYPGICPEIPSKTLGAIDVQLNRILGRQQTHLVFMRLSLYGVLAPHFAHTDATMGRYSLMLYLTDGDGGTALVRHENGMTENPANLEELDVWLKDANRQEKWTPYLTCPMKQNRAFLFRADLFHAALPAGGFGTTPKDGRLVLTAFLS